MLCWCPSLLYTAGLVVQRPEYGPSQIGPACELRLPAHANTQQVVLLFLCGVRMSSKAQLTRTLDSDHILILIPQDLQ